MKTLVLIVYLLQSRASAATLRLRGVEDRPSGLVDCRVTVTSSFGAEPESTPLCIPITSEGETDDTFPLALPQSILSEHQEAISAGQLLLQIQGATHVEYESLSVSPQAKFTVHNQTSLPSHLRKLESEGDRRLSFIPGTTGKRVLGVIRISTRERDGSINAPKYSAKDLEEGLFGNGYMKDGVTAVKQFYQCSNGKLEWIPHPDGVHDIIMPNPASSYSVGSLEQAVTLALKQKLRVGKMTDYAHNTMFVMPPGMGGFFAQAPVNHWRSSYHNDWGLSLQGILHELGHNLGLGHAYDGSMEYGDHSGVMGSGGTSPNSPQTCYNGFNHDKLGWLSDKTQRIDTSFLNNRDAKLIKLSAYVDYGVAESYEPVIVDINHKFYVQYNRNTKYNKGTREYENMLTVHTREGAENAATNVVAALGVRGQFVLKGLPGPGKRFIIRVCRKVNGDANSPDALIVSFGFNSRACRQTWTP